MTGRLAGRICLVTGAAGGIGAAVASRFEQEGASVFRSDLEAQPGPDGGILACDVHEEAAVEALVTRIERDCGGIDVLVHAAARLGGSGPVLDVAAAEFESFVAVNLVGSFLVARGVARAMVRTGRRGRIILIGSVNSFAAEPEAAPYVASKGGVRMLAKAMAVDLARYGITVNLLAPGAVTVPRNRELFASAAVASQHGRDIPLGTPGLPADIAHAALFLAEEGSRYVTGAELVVDGGLLSSIFPTN